MENASTEAMAKAKSRRSIFVPVISAVLMIVCLLYFFLVLDGNFTMR